MVYSPGLSDFHQKIAEAFAAGLAATDWSVDIVTASSQAPTDLTGYALLVIGGPIYGGQPSKPVQDYTARLGDLKGLRVYTRQVTAGPRATSAKSLHGETLPPAGAFPPPLRRRGMMRC